MDDNYNSGESFLMGFCFGMMLGTTLTEQGNPPSDE